MRVGLLFVSLLLVVEAACTGDGASDVHQRCEQVRDHLVDLRLRQVAASDTSLAAQLPTVVPAQPGRPAEVVPAPSPIDLDAHRKAMKQALGDRFIQTCASSYHDSRVRCLLAADSSSAVNACNHPPAATAAN